MKKILYPLFTAILVAMLVLSPAGARGGVSLNFTLSSLLANIVAWGLPSNTDYTFTLTASGVASVVCTNAGNNPAPGQNYPHVEGTDSQDIPWQQIYKGGKVTTSLEAMPYLETHPDISWQLGGCPNPNWSAKVDFIYWNAAEFEIIEADTGNTRTYQYSCVTTRTEPKGDPNSTFDDGNVVCTRTN